VSGIAVVGYTAVGVLIAGWLFVAFGRPGQTRSLVAWLGASALYVALLSLFVNLLMRARESDSMIGMVAFGFLVAFFTAGLVTSLWKTVAQARGAGRSGTGATG
jgi:fucose 4-O-acetylase-like acetyltransferase